MCIVMGADTATNAQPAASPGRNTPLPATALNSKHVLQHIIFFLTYISEVPSMAIIMKFFSSE